MTKRRHCLWITNSGIRESETFLIQSLRNLQEEFDVTALSKGPRPTTPVDGVIYDAFTPTLVRPSLVDRLWRKLGSKVKKRTSPSDAELFKTAIREHGGRWDFAWVHFGTTVPVVGPYLEENNMPFFIQVHGYDVTMKFADGAYKSQFVRWANLSKGVVCSSNHIRRICILAGVREDNVFVIGNALNVSELLKIKSEKTIYPSFVHFGRLTGKKHPLATLHAFILVQRVIPESQITFIGRGNHEELASVAESHGIAHLVNIMGPMPQADALPLVASHWVFCQHSVTDIRGDQEGFANSPAEASLLGMPVVSTFHNGLPEHVLHEETGFLVKEFDYEAMAKYMIELAQARGLREAMGASGRINISNRCDPKKRAKAVKELVLSRLESL